MKMQLLEAEIRSCLSAENPMAAINKTAKEMKEKAKELSTKAQAHLSNVFEEILAKISATPANGGTK